MVEEAVDGGSSFTEAAAKAKLTPIQTPLITSNGQSRVNAGFKLPPELAAVLKSGFELSPDDDPIVDTLGAEAGYALVQPAQVVPAAPAPLASIRELVAKDWAVKQASDKARSVAAAIAAKTARGIPLAQAAKESGAPLPPVRPLSARRLDLTGLGPNVPPAIRMLFTLGQGKSRMVGEAQGRGFSVVKVNKIVPGNALLQPALIARVQAEFQQAVSQEYAEQFTAAVRKAVGTERNEKAIAATKQRILGGS
jgi:peptidyl-prolyl cis-trans isomerase D